MANVVSPGDIFEGGGGPPFVDKDMKQRLASEALAFGITGAIPRRDNQFGEEEVRYQIVFEQSPYTLTLPHTEMREEQAKNVLQLLAGNPGAIVGPMYLTQVTTGSGKTAWALVGTKPDAAFAAATVAMSSEPVAAESQGVPSDDDIPF